MENQSLFLGVANASLSLQKVPRVTCDESLERRQCTRQVVRLLFDVGLGAVGNREQRGIT
jgi:hypothetical protein